MMRAAIYARYSTDKQKKESAEDQLALLRKRCAAEGWTVAGEFADPGISGGTANRPGYQRMLAAARRKEFAVVVTEDTSRLWRSMAEQAPRLAEWKDLGIRLVTLSGIDSAQQGFALIAPMMGAFAELARTEASYRTRRGLQANALRGVSTGGRAYGYDSVEQGDGSKRLVVNDEQSAVVRRIFTLYAEGVSPRAIAEQLNAERIPSPGSAWARTGGKRRDSKWVASAIHGEPEKGTGILNNPKYVGLLTWGRTSWTRSAQDSKVRRVAHLARPEVASVDESLRIVPDALWDRAQARRKAVRARTKQRGHSGGKGPRYAFSGLLVCAECGSRYVIAGKNQYACATFINGGRSACGNSKRINRGVIEQRIAAELRDELLTAEVERRVLTAARRLKAERDIRALATEDTQAARRRELEAKVANLTDAIACGQLRGSPAIAAALAEAERELAALTVPARPKATVTELLPQALVAYRRMVRALPNTLSKEPDKARVVLQRLFGEIRVVRTPDGGYAARLETSPAALIALVDGSGGRDDMVGSGGRI